MSKKNKYMWEWKPKQAFSVPDPTKGIAEEVIEELKQIFENLHTSKDLEDLKLQIELLKSNLYFKKCALRHPQITKCLNYYNSWKEDFEKEKDYSEAFSVESDLWWSWASLRFDHTLFYVHYILDECAKIQRLKELMPWVK